MTFNRKSAVYVNNPGMGFPSSRPARNLDNYQSLQTAIWRHQYTANAPQVGTPAALPPDEYFIVRLMHFIRTGSATPDDPPTPTASNNYQNADVFNGSRVENLDATIRLKNQSSTVEATLDIYELSMSFFDVLLWNTVRTAACPLTFNTVAPNQGNVSEKAVLSTIILDNDWNNFKYQQKYLKKVGTVTIGNSDNNNVAEFKINRIPPKCRRSQTGMYFGYVFANDTNKNNAATLTLEYTLNNNFDEFPSENRLPYID